MQFLQGLTVFRKVLPKLADFVLQTLFLLSQFFIRRRLRLQVYHQCPWLSPRFLRTWNWSIVDSTDAIGDGLPRLDLEVGNIDGKFMLKRPIADNIDRHGIDSLFTF